MLNLEHPLSKHVFAASRSEDAILIAARDMTTASQLVRAKLKEKCVPHYALLRQLAKDYFSTKTAIPEAINELERSIENLATLRGVPKDGPPPERRCSSCNTKLYRCNRYGFKVYFRKPSLIYCPKCLEIIMPSLSVLRSCEEGFGTDAI